MIQVLKNRGYRDFIILVHVRLLYISKFFIIFIATRFADLCPCTMLVYVHMLQMF